MFGHLPASLKVKVQERAVGAAHHIGGGDNQQRQDGGAAGDHVFAQHVPQLFDQRGAAHHAYRQQHAVVPQEIQRRHPTGGDKELLEQQPEGYAGVVAHEHRPAHHHEEQGVEMRPHPAFFR